MEYIDDYDLAAAVVRSVAAALHGKHPKVPQPEFGPRTLMYIAEQLGPGALAQYYKKMPAGPRGVTLEQALEVRSDGFCRWVVGQYPNQPYERVVVGPPNGAMAYLAAVIGAPYLVTDFALNIADEGNFSDPLDYLERSKRLADKIFRRNPDLTAVSVYDPVHLGHIIRKFNRLYVKFTEFPESYRRFLKDRLLSKGTVILVNQIPAWQQYRIGPKLKFQIGSYGDLNDDEYLLGSNRLKAFKEYYKMPTRGGWAIKATNEVFPEAEYGCLPELMHNLEEFTQSQGFKLLTLTERLPEDYSRKIFNFFFRVIQTEKKTVRAVYINAYSTLDPWAMIQGAIVPLWVPGPFGGQIFKIQELLKTKKMKFDTLLLALTPAFHKSLDIPRLKEFQDSMDRFGAIKPLGVSARHYPYNPSCEFRWAGALRSWVRRNGSPIETRFNNDVLRDMLQGVGAS